ncbi:MAG: alpha/beta fold hydrolase [Bacteroidota bacterium]
MKKYIFLLFSVLFYLSTNAQSIVGDWSGILNTPGSKLKIVFHIEEKNGLLIGTMDSPDQGAFGLKLNFVSYVSKKVIFDMSTFGIIYEGENHSKDSIKGFLKQAGVSTVLNLGKSVIPINKKPLRPQEPDGFVFYKQKEVTFFNEIDKVELSGTLTIPRGKGPFPAVVLVSGSGPQNRNEELLNHKPFLVLADFLTKNGIAVLRYDDRGVGKSKGNFQSATTTNFAYDAQAAFLYLKNIKKIDENKIGIIGHSEGGMVAPMVAVADTQVRFVVLLAGPGVPMDQLMLKQTEVVSRLGGISEEEIKVSQELNRKFYDILLSEDDNEKAKILIEEIVKDHVHSMPEEIAKEIVDDLPKLTQTMLTPWFRYFIRFNPEFYLKQIDIPILAFNGTKDCQVSAIENLDGIRKSVKETNNKNVYTYIMPDLNHLFQHCETGSVNEYAIIEETFSLEVMEIIRDWIKKTQFK